MTSWPEAEIEIYDEVVARFGEDAEPVAVALVNKGIALGQLGHREAAGRVFDEVLARYAEAAEPTLREAAALARSMKARIG